MKILTCLFLCALSLGDVSNAYADKKPIRVASLGLCTDQILLLLADHNHIATVSRTAADPHVSYMAAHVGNIPLNQSTAEEIIPFHPDLILSTSFAAPEAVRILKRLGYRVELMPLPTTIEDIHEMLLLAGNWLGETEKAQKLLREMDANITASQKRNAHKPERRAIMYSPNGYTIGSNTLENDVLRVAGYRNLAAEMGVTYFQQISVETLVTINPERILIDNYAYNQNSLAYSYINHPVLKRLASEENRMYVPSQLRDCAGPQVAEEIAWLADHR